MYGRRKLCTLGIKNLPDVPDMIDACDAGQVDRVLSDRRIGG